MLQTGPGVADRAGLGYHRQLSRLNDGANGMGKASSGTAGHAAPPPESLEVVTA
jgi:hypothetical protein